MPADDRRDARLSAGLDRLRELGYLRSPAELFVAEKVTPRGGLVRTAMVAGAWVGIGGGILAGLMLAISVLVAVPDLLTRPRDLAWLSLDLVLVSALGAGGIVSIFTALLLSWGRWRKLGWSPRAERALLLIAVLPPAVYLADLFGRFLLHRVQGWLWWAAALGAAGTATLLAASWGRVLRALLAAAGLAPDERGGFHLLHRIRFQTWFLVAIGSMLLLLLGPYRSMRALPRLDQIPARGTEAPAGRVLLVTLDGVSAADLSSARRLVGEPRPFADEVLPRHPAVFWNSLATGFEARMHGLQTASAYAPAGVRGGLEAAMRQPVLATVLGSVLPGLGLGELRATDQRELLRPPFWEIAVHCGRRASILNAWATYPSARHPRLSILSDRCFLRMWEGEAVDADSHLQHPLRPELLQQAQRILESRGNYPTVARGDSILGVLPLSGLENYRAAWEYAVASDLFHAEMAKQDYEAGEVQLVAVHLGGADILQRAVLRVPRGAARDWARRLGDLHRRFVDRLLGELLEDAAGNPCYVVSSMLGGKDRSAEEFSSEPDGKAGLLEFAPRVLRRLGVPPARDMQGGEETPAGVGRAPSTWGRRAGWTPVAERSSRDLERLRSLGYIGGS